jgi:hypothetical protein
MVPCAFPQWYVRWLDDAGEEREAVADIGKPIKVPIASSITGYGPKLVPQ